MLVMFAWPSMISTQRGKFESSWPQQHSYWNESVIGSSSVASKLVERGHDAFDLELA